ncbi:MAG: hypothetical protein ABJB12_11670 [Pseudomonadota bacterium]
MKNQRIRALPSLIVACTLACAFAACGGPKLGTLAPGVYGEAGEASMDQASAPSTEAGAAGSVGSSDAGAGGSLGGQADDSGSYP